MVKLRILLLFFTVLSISCKEQNTEHMSHKYTNDLIHETSPYLLQHAHNPVNWKPWNSETLAQAQEQNKLLLISVGYSACHWCHVMERESFEDTIVAQVMNDNFINIKVDREERPDVDQIYMNAVQLMTGSGGWPLNVVALPDGRPIWGGTYFTKEQWIKSLEQINEVYLDQPQRLEEYASKLEEGIKTFDIITLNTEEAAFDIQLIDDAVSKWSESFDNEMGGTNRSPKFMMPNNIHFLLRQAYQNNDETLQSYVNTTLTKMAYGGVYDQIGGGFSRYSVDEKWHVPHFEKMLYDNAQLVSLYSDAYLITKNPLYKSIVEETLIFVERELTDSDGSFYSSLDADSETEKGDLEEGTYYVWNKTELKETLGNDYDLFADYYNINSYGLWEHGNYVLIRNEDDESFVTKHVISYDEFYKKRAKWKTVLYELRSQRIRPRLDDKALTSWNGMMLKGYVDAYRVLGNQTYLETAIRNAQFIVDHQIKEDGGLLHSYIDGKSTINGYLEDYAFVIEAFLALYEVTFDQRWLMESMKLANYCFDHFYDDTNKMFFFTSNEDPSLVSRSVEYTDNFIPASNSVMAKNLFKLSHYFDNEAYMSTAKTMLNNVIPEMNKYPSAFSNWLDLLLNCTDNYYEVAIVGDQASEKVNQFNSHYLPNKLLIGSTTDNDLPLLKNRYVDGRTLIYVCVNKACKLPVEEVEKAITLIE